MAGASEPAFLDDVALVDREQKDSSSDISIKDPTPAPPPTPQSLTPLPDAQIHERVTVIVRSHCSPTLPNPRLHDPALPLSAISPSTAQNFILSPGQEEATHSQHRFRTLRWRLASGYFACFILSWADGVTGTVLPYLKAEFNLSTMTLSLLWGGNTCGYFAGTFLVESILRWLGHFNFDIERSKNIENSSLVAPDKNARHTGHSASRARHLTLLMGSVLHAIFFAMMGSKSGFSVMFVAYAVAAFARAVLNAILNSYFASGPKQALGYAYGLAGLGAMASPLVCQSVITTGVPWFHFYLGSLVLSALNVLLLAVAFKPNMAESAKEHHLAWSEARARAKADCGARGDADPSEKDSSPSCPASSFEPTNKHNTLKKALCIPLQWLFCAFALLYSGSETTTQGFMVTYLLATKHANPKTVGFVTSGFWAGLSVGRVCWGYFNGGFTFGQRKHVILFLIFLGLILEVLIWVVRSHVQNSIATAFIGLFYGPIVPAALAIANDVLPGDVQMVAMALINAFASLGGAVFPIVAGTVLNFRGLSAFPFITVPLSASLIVLWGLFPSRVPTRTTGLA